LTGSPFPLASAFLRWKYLDNPYYHEPSIYLALAQDRVVGMRGVCGGNWEASGQDPTLLLVGVDTGLDPDFRDGSLYRDLNEFAFADLASRGHHAIISLSPTAEAYLAAVMTMGWKGIGSLAYKVRSDRPMTATRAPTGSGWLRARVAGVARRVPPLINFVRSRRKRAPFARFDSHAARVTLPRHLTVSSTPAPELMEDLVEGIGTEGRIRHSRDVRYLTWRYKNPSHSYRFLYWGKGALDGYLVLMRGSSNQPTYIVDWEAADPEVAGSLLDAVTGTGAFTDLRTWGVGVPSVRLDILARAGFTEPVVDESSRHAGRFIVRALDSGRPALEIGDRRLDRVTDWDLRMIYSSAF
jgi:hypothetical protein